MTLLSPRRRAMHTAPYKLHHVLCVILLHFLVAFAQGQGPGIIELSVVENSIVGTVVGSVDYVQGYSYSFQEPNSLFELSTSGTLRTLDSIDRESIPESLVRLFVVGTPPTTLDSQVTFSVVITVLDVNDNRPDFQVDDNKEIIAFQEDAREGRTKSIITASDPDGGNNGTVSYRIASGNEKGMFGLDFTGLPLILYLVKRGSEGFDREKLDYYELVVSACDGGVPPLCTELTVGVNILDVNDNTPAFDLSDYTTQVNESAPVGSSVFRAEATDEDIGLNGEVSYRLEDESNQFKIDENTGVIETVTSPLACSRRCGRSSNKCSPNSCFIKIVASDKGLNALSGRAYLYIEVLDENDHNPIISFSKDNADITTASVDESADLQTVVFTVTVTDEDSGANGETSLRIIKGNEEGYFFHLSIPQYDINEIQVQKALDRETINKFNLTFEAVDHGSPQRTSTAHILIYVNDANDHQPVFDRDDYSVSLSEFSKPHSFVANVRATDKDEGVNSKLTYQISSGNEFSWFNIDPDTGLVTTRTYIDHEKSAMVVLNISAHDGGSIPKYSHAVLSITVGDENDCAPKFSKSSYKLELEENIPPAADITTLSAVDLDSAENGTVEFSIHPDTEMQFPNTFQIHPTSGKLTAQKRFDREEKSHYVIKVIAQDKGPQPLSSTATIDLSIKDVNDNPPKFTPKENYVNVFDSDPAGLQVVSVSAHDKDTGENGKILYALRNSINDFEIDKDSGMISTSRQLSAREYRLVVSAVDGGGRPSENDAIIKVIVISISSLAPVFTDSEYNFRIREDEQEKQHQTDRTVGQVQATSQTSQPVTYAIIDGDVESVFKIGASSGVISTLSAIDREVQPQYTLTVIALAGEKIISKKVTVTVEDVNDNSPEFLTHTTEATVLENWPVGHNIFLAQATDSDAGNNRVITYSLASADDTNDVFAIDAQTGVISLAKPPNQLASDSTTLTVTATDGGSSPRSRSMQVVMRLEDVNDHTPLFALTRHELFVSEAQSVNEVVMEVHATDEDEGPNGDLSYSIVRGNEEHRFGIFPEGSLFVAHGLDREKRDMYSLTITVKDNGKEPRSSSVNITVYVQDENDNAPEFTQVSYEFRVRENMPADSYVGSVKAVDNDLGRNAEILYSLGGGNVNFTIDPILGTIFTKREFDREYIVKTTNLPYYVFDVYASDNGLHKQQSKVSVRVNVLDENDSPPVFLQASGSSRAVSENTEVGEEITTLVAVDADAGANAAVTYAITAGNEDGKFRIHETDGKLFLQLALDRESRDHYMLTIKATDTGESVQLESTTDLEIYVLDYNDNAPEFAADTVRSVTVSETTLEGENLAIFSGTDRDMGNNAKLRFDIVSGNEDDTFRLNMATGYLYLARELNYEAKREHVLNITLSDSGFPALSVSLTFKVIVLDANDNAPVFLHGQSRIHIKENRDVGSSIAEVSAKDEDSGELGQVRFSIYKQTPVGDHFQINPVSGVITLSNAFDREVADSFEVTIHATDQVSNPALRRTSEKFLTILVDDVNDNPPVFNSPSVFLVAYPSPSGTTVASLSASDVDDGDNAKVTFNFVGAKPLLFNLNPSTGTISLAQDLPASHLSYTLTVIATDGVRGSSSSTVNTATATVTLLLYTSSGVGPVFLSSNPKSGTVDENMPEGTEVLRMSAQPSKPGLGSVEYYITRVSAAGQDYAEVFTVGRSSGVVSTAAILDREKLPASLQVDINAVEKENGEQRVTTTQVEISIVDKNDNPPVFSSSLYDAEVKEAGQSDSSVARVFVTDPDPTASLSLTLSGPDSGNFRIGQDGVVTAVKPLDYGKQRTYRMSVDASDGKHQVRSSLHLTVVDINDHAPSFDRPFYSFEVLESARPGATIGHVLATDQDNGLNARVTYELQSEWGKEYFLLDEVQGSLTLLKELDYEERQLYTLKVIAKDAGSPPLNSVVTVYVDVKDANDNQPLFDPVSYYREISEDAEILTWLVNVSATDMDSGHNGDVRYSLQGEGSNLFAIGPINGSVYTTSILDREKVPVYNLVVMATDQADLIKDRMSTTTTIQVKLTDVNDSPPKFLVPPVLHVPESAQVGTTVYRLLAEDADEGINNRVAYSLISQTGPGQVFSVDAGTGALVINSALDREKVPNHTLIIQAQDGGSPHFSVQTSVVVQVSDDNDNAPIFSKLVYNKTLSEDTAVGTSLLRLLATDADEGFNGAVRYFIIGGEGSQDFHLDMSSGVLRVQKALDYERTTSYRLQVQAEDSSVLAPRHANATVVISVTDVNDFVPVFHDSPYKTYVQEGMPPGPVPVITVEAIDKDSGYNGIVKYSLRDLEDRGLKDLFQLEIDSGELTVLKPLDRETTPMYVLTVVAEDQGGRGLTGTATVTVLVKDVNDHSPVFESNGPYVAHVTENRVAGTEVVRVSAADGDEGQNAHILYSFHNNPRRHKFSIHPHTGQIVTTGQLDRELVSEYDLVVVATDQGIPPRSSSVNVTILVDDDNDHAPDFGTGRYSVIMYDSSKTTDFVLGVTAVDRDVGNNGRVHYTLAGGDERWFHISSDTGVVTLASSLTQSKRSYSFVVRASDLGKVPLTSNATVNVQLSSNTDTNRPQFQPFDTRPSIKENTAAGAPLTTVRATSSRGDGRVTYHIAGGNVNNGFTVNSDTGLITVARTIDYEVTNRFNLWLEARDQGTPPLSTVQLLEVSVLDENDNSPKFQKALYVTDLEENCQLGTSVIKVVATDDDSGPNQQLTYSIKAGNENNTFAIDADSGQITTRNSVVDREKIALYNLEVQALDAGTPTRKSATTTVRVSITDKNDHSPVFTGSRSVAVPEDLPIGSLILQLTTADLDIGDNARVSFAFVDASDIPFEVDPASGNITNVAKLDAELQNRYQPSVTATDGAFLKPTRLTITLLDVNDNAPQFQFPHLEFNFTELQRPNARVGVLTALDLDISSPNNKFFFSLKRPSSLFELNAKTGEILALETMRYLGGGVDTGSGDSVNHHVLDVVVTDLGVPSLSSHATVLVRVMDANDHAPEFEEATYFSAVPDTLPTSGVILRVAARDEMDYGKNAEVLYSIERGSGRNFFKIDASSGDITPKTSLSGKVGQSYSLTVKATDRGNPPMSSTATVDLVVTEVNANTPVFTTRQFHTSLREDARPGSSVATITANDRDLGINGEIVYLITTGNEKNLFAIDPSTGELTVEGELDYEKQTSYTITVVARDKGHFYREDSRLYTINITDVNDNKPEFDREYYDAYIVENSGPFTPIFTLTAKDADTLPSNKEIKYSIVGDSNSKNFFRINQDSGQITSANTVFDYEQHTLYTLLVMAFNPNPDSASSNLMKSVTTVYVHVTGENEDSPHFVRKAYNFQISEAADVGTSVGRVSARDDDKGVDGVVYYYLEGSSNLMGLSLEPTSGVLRVADVLDFETRPNLMLTVIAKNWGSVRANNTDTCTVNVTVTDANDPPRFTERIYTARIPENSSGHTSVTHVTATDDDDWKADNREFSYVILNGNDLGRFQIYASGRIETTGLGVLDRETNPTYTLVVGAVDTGKPPRTGSATVEIQLTDVNDKAPRFDSENLRVYVPENETAGQRVVDLSQYTVDDDLPPNQGPFTYRLDARSPEAAYFWVDETTGVVQTKTTLSRKDGPEFYVSVVVTDNGIPQLASTLTFTVVVNGNSPPKPRPMEVMVTLLEGVAFRGTIADVQPLGSNLSEKFSCQIVSGDSLESFVIVTGCELEVVGILTPSTSYVLRVRGDDGKFEAVEYDVTVTVKSVSNKTLSNSVAMVLSREKDSAFLSSKLTMFTSAVEKAFGPTFKSNVYSLRQEGADLLVFLSVEDSKRQPLPLSELVRGLTLAESVIAGQSEVTIRSVSASTCDVNPCRNKGSCVTAVVLGGGVSVSPSPALVMASPSPDLAASCLCPAAFTGPLCQQAQDRCGSDYCSNQGYCQNGRCQCPDTWHGEFCREDVDECQTTASLCKNGGTCQNTQGSFKCNCPAGFHGPFCEVASYCAGETCSGRGECRDDACRCRYEYHGGRCEEDSMGFSEDSYAEFRPVDNYETFNMSLYFATLDKTALLMFSPVSIGVGAAEGFIAMEVVKRKLRVSFMLDAGGSDGPSVVSLSTSDDVNTGYWYRVEFAKVTTSAFLVVQRCVNSTCEPCQNSRPGCYSEIAVPAPTSSVQGRYVSVGGVRNFSHIVALSGRVASYDFKGCMHSVSVNGRNLAVTARNLLSGAGGVDAPLHVDGVSDQCPRSQPGSVCLQGKQQCANRGVCVDLWSEVTCQCPAEFTGDTCAIKRQPFSLGPSTVIKYTVKPSYHKKTQLAAMTQSRRRRATPGVSTLLVRFRSTAEGGVLYTARTHNVSALLWFEFGQIYFLLKTRGSVMDPLVMQVSTVSDGRWHNVTVTATGTEYFLEFDGTTSQTRDFGIRFSFDSSDMTEMTISGNANVPPNNKEINGLDGCLSLFHINGEALPLNGSTDKYDIEVQGKYSGNCSALCEHNPCGGSNTCVVDGEVFQCLLVAESSSLETGIIVVIVFFVILLIAIVVVFVLFRTRRDLFQRCVKTKKENRGLVGSSGISGNGKANVHVDSIIPAVDDAGVVPGSRYALNPNEGEIIRNHIMENLAGQKTSSLTARPDLIGSSYSPQPVQLADGTVIMETGEMTSMMGGGAEEDAPELYDFENASSIAPSDITPSDVIRHYRDFRNGTHHHYKHQNHKQPSGLNNHLFNKYRDSPASMSASNYRASPQGGPTVNHHIRQSPVSLTGSALSVPNHTPPSVAANGGRPSSALAALHHQDGGRARASPLTQLNVRSPRTHPHSNYNNSNNSRSNSAQSIGSHHSHSSSSSATGMPSLQPAAPPPPPSYSAALRAHNSKPTSSSRGRPPKGLTVEDVNRLNARPDYHDPVSMMDAGSSSVKERPRLPPPPIIPHEPVLDSSILLEPPDSSSDDSGANDSFTCSEFEYDNENARTKLDLDPSKRIFSQLTEVENESDEAMLHYPNQSGKLSAHSDGLNSNGDSFASTNASSSGSPSSPAPHPVLGSTYDFDALLNWGPNFDKLVGVFRDIAQLPDTGQQTVEGAVDHDYEEYV